MRKTIGIAYHPAQDIEIRASMLMVCLGWGDAIKEYLYDVKCMYIVIMLSEYPK